VLIQRFCGTGNGIAEAYTDAKGRFSFELGKLTGFNPDATQGYASRTPGQAGEELTSLSGMMDRSFGRGYGEKVLTGCTLRAALPGFRSTALDLGPREHSDDPDVGAIVLNPLEGVEGLGVSLISLRAPEDARESFQKGMKDFEKRKWGNARKHFERAIDTYSEYADAWFALGRAFEEDGKTEEAWEAFEKAAAMDGRFVPPLIGLARLEAGRQRWGGVIERTDRILAMNPNDFVEPYFYSAMAHFNEERFPAAERSAREALARGAEAPFPQVVHLLALSLGYQGHLEEAVAHLKRYIEIVPDSRAAATARKQLEGMESYLAQQ
jgi:tetratricopeptide (TPR) repeat protein